MNKVSDTMKFKYSLLVVISVIVIFGHLIFVHHFQLLKLENAKIVNLLGKEQILLNKINNNYISSENDSSKHDKLILRFEKLNQMNAGLIDEIEKLGIQSIDNEAFEKRIANLNETLITLQTKSIQSIQNNFVDRQSVLDSYIRIQTIIGEIADEVYQDTEFKFLLLYRLQIALSILAVVAFLVVLFFNYFPLETKLQDSIFKLEKQDENLRSLINSTRESIYFLSKAGKLLYFNKLGKEMLLKRLGEEVQLGDDFEQFLSMGMADRYHDCFQKALNLQKSEMEWQVVIEGKLVWYYFGFFPVVNEKSEVLGVSFIASNIHEKKQAALKNEEFIAELEKIAWRESHLLRAPVANIIGLSKLLLRNPERQLSGETEHLLNMISVEAEKMDQEIHKIVQHSSSLSLKSNII